MPNSKSITLGALALVCMSVSPGLAQSWSGPYAGVGVSYDNFDVNDRSYGPGSPASVNGGAASVFAGYNFQRGALVFGPELSIGTSSADGSDGNYLLPAEIGTSVALRGRIGYDAGKFLPYLALGVVRTKFSADHRGFGNGSDQASDRAHGVSVAVGVDWALAPKSFLRVEVERLNYSDSRIPFYSGSDEHSYSADGTRLTVGYALRF